MALAHHPGVHVLIAEKADAQRAAILVEAARVASHLLAFDQACERIGGLGAASPGADQPAFAGLAGFRRIDAFQADAYAVDDESVAIDDLGQTAQFSLAASA